MGVKVAPHLPDSTAVISFDEWEETLKPSVYK